ncbi:hypothetical protein GCM10022297_08760 [Lactobacillus hamsteri]|uniref:Uncharacterized protein n=1 Tax=Lactobacillus hamsteri DSM 5661 = JCM 6256 TaxID=1423754 RepID=A0A0R1YPL5_9LACO|nr:hypothetical protein [Lactobacillus hamsteri]KRM41164.1 hypothetical protein FC39_GL001366 [Lactobacillus hamsteri DSM 5661 = JCM 6256]
MRLYNLIEFLNNLNEDTELFLRIHGQDYPLSKITITADECLLYPGKQAMTKKRMYKMIKNLHRHTSYIWMMNGKEKIEAYGIQISIENYSATLM